METWNPLGGIFVVNAAFHSETPGLGSMFVNGGVESWNLLRGKRRNPDRAKRFSLSDLEIDEFPRENAQLEFDEIDLLVDALRDEMLDLQARVDLHEVEAARGGVAEELDGRCALVAALLRESERPGVETRSFFVC